MSLCSDLKSSQLIASQTSTSSSAHDEENEPPLWSTWLFALRKHKSQKRSRSRDIDSSSSDDELIHHSPTDPIPSISPVLTRGDLAPTSYSLMSITNPGGIALNHFRSSPFSFVRSAVLDLTSDHYEDTPAQQLTGLTAVRKSQQSPWVIPSTAPNSAKYSKLIKQMVLKGIVAPLSSLNKFMADNNVNSLTILRLFAVVKDHEIQTARPIENGNPIKPPNFNSGFSLPGATQFVETLLSTNTAGMVALHGDLANYYFQVPISEAQQLQHAFQINGQLFVWRVLTMGYFKATRIAESLCLDLVLRGSQDVPHETAQPNGLLRLRSGGFLAVIYDSFLLVDKLSIVQKFDKLIETNCENANAILKYKKTSKLDEEFEYCGFLLKPGQHFLSWKIAPSTLDTWKLKLSVPLPSTLRSLWSLGGILQFAITVRLIDRRMLADFRQFQALYGAVDDSAWDRVKGKTVSQLIHQLKNFVLSLDNNSFLTKEHGSARGKNIIRGVFDATTTRWSCVLLSKTNVVSETSGSFSQLCQIDHAEAFAAAQCLIQLLSNVHSDNAHVILLAGDNQSVLKAFRSGASASDGIKLQIDRSGLLLFIKQFSNTPVILVDLPSEENYADIGTRPNKSYSELDKAQRLANTLARVDNAITRYTQVRSTYVDRTDSPKSNQLE